MPRESVNYFFFGVALSRVIIFCITSVTTEYLLLLLCEEPSFINIAASWQEQRQFVYMAIEALQDHPVVSRIIDELNKLVAEVPDLQSKLLMHCVIFVTRLITTIDWNLL
jgi:hypothetical protein